MPPNPRTGLTGLEQRVLKRFRALEHPRDRELFVGFSGGLDSLALAGVLSRIVKFTGQQTVLVHVDHGLRPGSRAEAHTAGASALALNSRFIHTVLKVKCTVLHPHVGLEEAARRERYAAFARVVGSGGTIALAHHQSDQAETVLLHLLRGAGLRGAAGMAEWTQIVVPWWSESEECSRVRFNLWRPFLGETRDLVRAYGRNLGLEAVHDPTNDEPTQTRTSLRLEIIPVLELIQPGASAALARYGELAAIDDAYLENMTAKYAHKVFHHSGSLRTNELRELPEAIALRVIREWLALRHPDLTVSSDRTRAILSLALRRAKGRVVQIGSDLGVAIVGECLWVASAGALLKVANAENPASDSERSGDLGVAIESLGVDIDDLTAPGE
ncbi:MAG: tRNA lysidine(34) synthetase TilS [Chloroflexota bacterium]|nr:tRNA lysidine(34) synthetase TilS [Chloroflexota bacterium]